MPITTFRVGVRCEQCRGEVFHDLDRAEDVGAGPLDDVAREAARREGFVEVAPGDWVCHRCHGADDDE